jgi:RNA polymerase sigma factor (TIGR02999 family)
MSEDIPTLLAQASQGDRGALGSLLPMLYRELHALAGKYIGREGQGHTLQPTALINEAYVRLAEGAPVDYKSRTHFMAVAARVMREILVDHARRAHALKRGGAKITLDEGVDFSRDQDAVVVELSDALDALEREDAAKARLVEMRYFGGMSANDIAICLDTPAYTVRRQLRTAVAWLRREMET